MSEGVDPAVAVLLENLDRAYHRSSWHGPNLRGSLRGVDAAAASWRTPGRHTIAEQAVHAAYWKYVARRRLQALKRGSFPLAGSNWISLPEPFTASDWKSCLELLDREHELLREVVAGLPVARLPEPATGGRGSMTVQGMILGLAAHDIYHAGQIQFLRRLRDGSP